MNRDDFETKYHKTVGRPSRLVTPILQPDFIDTKNTDARYRKQTLLSQGSSGIFQFDHSYHAYHSNSLMVITIIGNDSFTALNLEYTTNHH